MRQAPRPAARADSYRDRVAATSGAVHSAVMPTDLESKNEKAVRAAYQVAENKDIPGWVAAFTHDGEFTDFSLNVTYRGPNELGQTVVNYGTAFPDMHRELYRFYLSGDIVVVELALQGTHQGPLRMPNGTIQPTGKRMDAPCCDVFRMVDGKIRTFNCYPSGTVILGQLGVLGNLAAALQA